MACLCAPVQAQAALRACNGSLERAADWLFSRGDSLDADVAAQNASPAAAPAASTPVSEAAGPHHDHLLWHPSTSVLSVNLCRPPVNEDICLKALCRVLAVHL